MTRSRREHAYLYNASCRASTLRLLVLKKHVMQMHNVYQDPEELATDIAKVNYYLWIAEREANLKY